MESLVAYIPMDRRQTMARGENLPDRATGAALFADISGFTPLTEALARELGPRRGAEELTRQLNVIYDALISEVHFYQGSVIGFSGDAITCWFDADDGVWATACALAIQQVMARFAEVETPSGLVVSLAIKVAVAVGPVRRFLVGDPRIQYIDVLAGTTLDRMAEAERLAGKGEVVLGPEAVSRLGASVEILEWRGEAKTGRRFALVAGLACQVEAAPWPEIPAFERGMSEGEIRPWLLPPVYERLRTGQGRFLAEIRPAVALFLRFTGLNYDQDEAAGEKLNAYIRWVQNTLARYESYLLQVTIGDKGSYLYAAFGAPLAHGDDPARAVAAALELRSPPSELGFITGVQMGISQGRMRTGAYGGPTRCTYGVLGDEVNIAARLMSKANPGQTLVSKRIADVAGKSYHFQYWRTLEVKGVKKPLPTFVALGRRLRPPMFTGPLFGREAELAKMEGVLERALAGKGQILRLEGKAGAGKSHLVAEFVEQALSRGWRVAQGTCQGTTYYPWLQIFRSLFGLPDEPLAAEDLASWSMRQVARVETAVKKTNPAWLSRFALVGDLVGLPIPDNEITATFDPKLRQEALFALAVEIVQAWALTQPLLLLLEDVHWMDEASHRLTLYVSRSIANVPVLLILVHRPLSGEDRSLSLDLDHLSYHTHLHLGDLSSSGIAALVTNRLQSKREALTLSLARPHVQIKPAALVLDVIQSQAQGNPFFAEELVDALCESGGLELDHDGTWTLSAALFNALREANCLEKRKGEWILASRVFLSASDLGIPDSIQGVVLSRIDRLPDEHKLTLKVASVIGHIFEFDLLTRSHPQQPIQEALLVQLKETEARDLTHTESPVPQLTHAFNHSIIHEVVYATLPDDQRHALHRAVGEVLGLLRPEAVERLAYQYSRSDMREKALFYLDQAARKAQREYANETALNYYNQALTMEERWEWRKGQVGVLHILGRRAEEREALELLEVLPEAPLFDVAYLWGQYHEAVGDYAQAQAAVERALAAARSQADVAGEGGCLIRLGLIARRQGVYDEAETWYNRALVLLQDKDTYLDEEAQALNELGIVYRQQGRLDEARECYEQSLALSRESGNRRGEAQALDSLGTVAFHQRDFARSIPYHEQALEIRREIGDRVGEGITLMNLGQVHCEAGDYVQALSNASAALAIHQETGNRWEEVNIWNDLIILYHKLGELPRARACAEQGEQLSQEIGDRVGQAYILSNLGQVARDQGDLVTAQKVLADSLALAPDDKFLASDSSSYLGTVSLLAGRPAQAIEWAKAALSGRGEEQRLLTTADLATLAAAEQAGGDLAKALDYARQALTILEECGGEGPESPQRDYFVCYQVLSAAGQEETAWAALKSAYKLVMVRAEKIVAPDLRQSFLERVQVNREIVQEYAKREEVKHDE